MSLLRCRVTLRTPPVFSYRCATVIRFRQQVNFWRGAHQAFLFRCWWRHYYVVTWLWQIFTSRTVRSPLGMNSTKASSSGSGDVKMNWSPDSEKTLYSRNGSHGLAMVFKFGQLVHLLVTLLLWCQLSLRNFCISIYGLAAVIKFEQQISFLQRSRKFTLSQLLLTSLIRGHGTPDTSSFERVLVIKFRH